MTLLDLNNCSTKRIRLDSSTTSTSSTEGSSEVQGSRKGLPIFPVRGELLKYVEQNESVIIIGETGSGKSTQIPQYIIESNMVGSKGIVAVTQPRRVAAVTLANRVAHEMGTQCGDKVGYQVRFESSYSFHTKIRYMTDGILLREAITDPELKKYRVVILDEAHERSISTDVLFAILKQAQKTRRNSTCPLKLIVMSATMDVDHFSAYLNNAPVLYVQGRQYPVTVKYVAETMQDYEHAALVTVFQIHRTRPPDEGILVFLTGQEEIDMAARKCREASKEMNVNRPNSLKMTIMPLYAAMNAQTQLKVFEPAKPGTRKVIFATNIAETSLTIPGISIIVDSGKVKFRDFNPSKRLEYLRVKRICQSSACQRAGRAGREMAGHCFRLYTEEEYYKMDTALVPEILRCNLSSAILELLTMGIEDITNFDLMDKPKPEAIEQAIEELLQIGAVKRVNNDECKLSITELGRTLTKFPLEPKLARVIVAGSELGCLDEMLIVVAMLSGENVLVHNATKAEECNEAHQKFSCPEGDHMRMLNIFRSYKTVKPIDVKNWCQANFILERNLKTIDQIRNQLSEICVGAGIAKSSCGSRLDLVRQALCYGYFMNCAFLEPDSMAYNVVNASLKAKIHPSSCLAGSKPGGIIYSELLLTNTIYARDISVVDKQWLIKAAPEFCDKFKITVKS